MRRALQRRISILVATIVAALCMTRCTAPLGPGFRIEHQELNVEYVSGAQPVLRVHAAWRVKNSGNEPLGGEDAWLPNGPTHSLGDVRAGLKGETLEPATAGTRGVRIAFAPPLASGEQREVALSYELRGAKSASDGTDVTELGFLLPPGDWAPLLLPPQGAFARGGEPPKKWELNFRVPAGWRVHAGGKLKGMQRGKEGQPASVVYRFEEQREGFAAFAAGGAFQEAKVELGGNEVALWTRQPVDGAAAQRYAQAAVGAAQFYDGAFGPRKKATRRWWIIECPRKAPCWPVPETALVGGGIAGEDSWSGITVELEQQLAYTWLDFQVHPDWGKEPLPMGALADYARELAAAAREGGDARRRIIHGLVASFDYEKSQQTEPAVFRVQMSDPRSARQFAGVKSELFLFALEDAAGKENLWRALRHLLSAYHGGTWRADDLRSALEQESGKNWGPLFRQWLVQPGIPEDFRSRY